MQNIPPERQRKLRTWTHAKQAYALKGFGKSGEEVILLDLASNDYLGLSKHPKLIEAVNQVIALDGVGAGASRLVTGSRPIHQELERDLASWLGQESVLLFPSGFQANLAGVLALADRSTTVIADRLIHHSLLIGVKASGANLKRFAHNDLDDLERHLKLCNNKNNQRKSLVLTESLFSMEGTSPPLQIMARLCEKHGAQLFVDEAHALGILGSDGRGLCHEISEPITLLSGTFGKAFGSGGAFLASSKRMREHLLQTCGAFRYSTALAPPLAAAALAALHLINENKAWGIELQKRANNWRSRLSQAGWLRPPGHGPILPLVIGTDQQALYYQNKLEKEGLLSIAIRPPTVPEGTSRLRLIIRRDLPDGTLERLLNVLEAS